MPGLRASGLFRDLGAPGFSSGSLPDSQDAIRAELFSVERLEQHAESVAAQRVLAEGRGGRPLSPRVRDSGRVLLRCYRELAAVIREEGVITPAAEWFVDNFHIVEDVLREVREDLPPGFYRRLPKLAEGPLEGYPRVLGLAWPFVAHTDSRFEAETLQRFVERFQRIQVLTIGELWAVPIALRLVLVENLRRLAERIVNGRAARRDADALANELLGLGGKPARPLAFRRLEAAALPTAFTVQLVQRLREQDPESTPALAWLNEQLSTLGTSPDEIVRLEHQRQAAMNVTVRNVITSMRTMATFDWADFFESVSLVDAALRAGSHFGAMDFATRDRYRHAIEDLARGSRRTELDVTQEAIARAKHAASEPGLTGTPAGYRAEDPGHYLISKGRRGFEREIGTVCTVGFYLIGVRYALVLGIVSGLLEFIPLIGPLVVALITTLIASSLSIKQALGVVAFLSVVRIVHDYVIYPRIIGRGMPLHPFAVIVAVLCGAALAGVPGIFLAIPTVAILSVGYRHWLEHTGSEGLVADLLNPRE